MISAFGVVHKGLPRALKNVQFKSWQGLSDRSKAHLAANSYGKMQASMKATGFTDERTLDQGRNTKAFVRRVDIRNANKKKKRVLP